MVSIIYITFLVIQAISSMYFYKSLDSSEIDANLIEFQSDCEIIKQALNNHGFGVNLRYACALWMLYSDSLCAGWMYVPNDDYFIVYQVKRLVFP